METNAKPTAQKLYEVLAAAGYRTRDQVDTLDLGFLRNVATGAGIAKRITPRHRDQLLAYFPKSDDIDPFAGLDI